MADSESVRDLLVRGVAAAKGKSSQEARFFLEWVLRRDAPQDIHVDAWWWLSQVADDPAEVRRCLEEILARDPTHPQARRAVAVLDGRLAPGSIVDADHLPRPSASPGEAKAGERFACPRCGGRLAASADGAWLGCGYCGWRRSLASEDAIPEQDFVVAMATGRGHRKPVRTRTFRCTACGAPYILAPEMLSLTCPYCGSPHVVEHADTEELIPPDGILPFRVSDPAPSAGEAARDVRTWLGLYLPMWSFDLSGRVPWKGVRQDRQERAPETVTGTLLVMEKSHLVPASRRLPEVWARSALAYDVKALRPFRMAALADWPAETYQVPMSDAAVIAHAEVFDEVRERSRREIPQGVEDVGFDSSEFAFDGFQLILAPIWIGLGGGTSARPVIVVNGQSGVVAAERGRGASGWLSRLLGNR
jgi:predicted  nucleic acid-binding Zn-ribbon protein